MNQGLAVVPNEEGQAIRRGAQQAEGFLGESAHVETEELAGPQLDRRLGLVGEPDRLLVRDEDHDTVVCRARAASSDPADYVSHTQDRQERESCHPAQLGRSQKIRCEAHF